MIKRDEFGEQKILKVKEAALTAYQVQQIQEKTPVEAKRELNSTRDKLIWFRHQVDKNTADFTQGFSELKISRENLIQDSMKHFLEIKDLRKVGFPRG